MTCLHKPGGAIAMAAALLLSGCASLSGDGGFKAAAAVSEQRTGAPASVAGRLPQNDDDGRALAAVIEQKLAQPLTANDAVHIAMLNNRGLQATYWSLGIAEADLVQAGRLQNPVLDFKRSHGGGALEIERALTFNLLDSSPRRWPVASKDAATSKASCWSRTKRCGWRRKHAAPGWRQLQQARAPTMRSRWKHRPRPARNWRSACATPATGAPWTWRANRPTTPRPAPTSTRPARAP